MNRIVVIGAGQAAQQLVASVRDGFAGQLTVIGREAVPPYYRPPLSKEYLVSDMPVDRLLLKPALWYDARAVDLRLGADAVAIDRDSRSVRLSDGTTVGYDLLVLATGMRARSLVVHSDGSPCHLLRDLSDAARLKAEIGAASSIAVIGGGYVGLEIAASAAKLGKKVSVLEREDRLLARVALAPLSRRLQALHEAHGVAVRLGAEVAPFNDPEEARIWCRTHGEIEADLVIAGIGGVSNTELAELAGLDVDNGILTDETGFTNDPRIAAIGDCANAFHPRYGRHLRFESVPNAIEQAKALARSINGTRTAFSHLPWFWSDQHGAKLQSAGLATIADVAVERVEADGRWSLFGLQGGRLVSVDCIDNPRTYAAARRLIEIGVEAGADQLADPAFDLCALAPA